MLAHDPAPLAEQPRKRAAHRSEEPDPTRPPCSTHAASYPSQWNDGVPRFTRPAPDVKQLVHGAHGHHDEPPIDALTWITRDKNTSEYRTKGHAGDVADVSPATQRPQRAQSAVISRLRTAMATTSEYAEEMELVRQRQRRAQEARSTPRPQSASLGVSAIMNPPSAEAAASPEPVPEPAGGRPPRKERIFGTRTHEYRDPHTVAHTLHERTKFIPRSRTMRNASR